MGFVQNSWTMSMYLFVLFFFWQMLIYLICLYVQEILDQLADIDLVVNLKCAENCLVKKHFEYHICPHCGKVFDSSNSESTCSNSCLTTCTCHALLKPSLGVDMKDQRMEKIHVYTEQVVPKYDFKVKAKSIYFPSYFMITRNFLKIIIFWTKLCYQFLILFFQHFELRKLQVPATFCIMDHLKPYI